MPAPALDYDSEQVWVNPETNQKTLTPDAKSVQREVMYFVNGEVWERDWDPKLRDWTTPRYVTTNTARYNEWKFEQQQAVPKSSPIEGVSSAPSQKYIVSRNPDGSVATVQNPNYVPPDSTTKTGYETPASSARKVMVTRPDGTVEWIDNPNYTPPTGPQRAPRYPDEEQLAQLNIQKAQRDLLGDYARAMQDAHTAISGIQEKIASGEMTPDDGNKMMDLVQQNLDATLRGTTPYQTQQDKLKQFYTQKQQQQGLASDILGGRAQQSGTMAQSLLSGASGIYGKILGGQAPPLDFNPLAMGQQFATENYGGQDMADIAKALLLGALKEQFTAPQGGY